MAQCKQSPQEFTSNAFTPQIAVMCSPVAEKCCQKNNFGFIELLQPFSSLNSDVQYKDPTGLTVNVRNLKLTFLDIAWRPPQTPLARKYLNNSVSSAPESKNNTFQVGTWKLDVPTSTPWFELWRDTFLKLQFPSDHEFTKHFLACLLVVSSSDNNPMDSIVQLTQNFNREHNMAPGKLPKWFNSTVLKYYVLVHDNVDGDSVLASKVFESMKESYGVSNCFLLKINSKSSKVLNSEHTYDPWKRFSTSPIDLEESQMSLVTEAVKYSVQEVGQEAEEFKNQLNYHPLSPVGEDLSVGDFPNDEDNPKRQAKHDVARGCYLSSDDVEQVKLLVYEFATNCLLPHIEKQLVILNDIVSNKKGVSKSLFSATKRWLSPNKPGASSVAVNNLIYSPDSQELQIRRLADLYFMFGHYSSAFHAYHLAKREYNLDQAWLYYAGALEMAALSAFMANESTRKTFDYMEESITTYLNTCKLPQFATRATLLSSECLKHQNMFGEAAHQLIRMTSEDSDLRSALLLEQAAYCFLESKMIRKYAFHMVLAGHRFFKAAQRKHSLKCYKQAYQIYENMHWDLASDHIHYTIGRQANNLQHFDEAVESFAKLLKGDSKQTASQQALFLKEYMAIVMNKLNTESEADQLASPVLPVPQLDANSIKVLVEPTRPMSTPGKIAALGVNFHSTDETDTESKWNILEEMLVQEAEGSLPLVFKPLITLYNINTLEKNIPVAIVNESIQVFLTLTNNLQTVLHLKDIYLLWTFNVKNETISNETTGNKQEEYVKTYVTKAITIQGNTKQDLVLSLTPLQTGYLTINGFFYTLTNSNIAAEPSFIKGKQLIFISNGKANVDDPNNIKEDEKKYLEINVVPYAPCLQVTFSDMHLDFLSNELQRLSVDFQNTSIVPLQNIYLATSVPHLLYYCEFKQPTDDFLDLADISTPALREKNVRKQHLTSVPLPGNRLEPGQATTIHIWVKAPNEKGPLLIDLLIYYESVVKTTIPRYRLVKHTWNLTVQESIAVSALAQTSHNSKSVEELALAMKITNLNKVHNSLSTEVMLLNVGLLSKNWTLTEDIVSPKYINLSSQEAAHILFKTKRANRKISKYSSIPLNNDKKVLHNLADSYLAFAKKAEQPSLTIFDDLDSFSFKRHNDGILLLQWQALITDANKIRTVNGQCSIPIEVNRSKDDVRQIEGLLTDPVIDISDKTITEELSQNARKQISYNLMYPPVIQHDFKRQKLCQVPIRILLHSIIDNAVLSVFVNTTEPSVILPKENKSNRFCTYASTDFCWLGNSKKFKILNPLMSDTVHLAVMLSGPGTFDLGAYIQVMCKKIDQPESYVLQSCQIHSALIVENSDS